MSQEEQEQEEFHPPYDHAAERLVKTRKKSIIKQLPEECEWVCQPKRHLTLLPKVSSFYWYPPSRGQGCSQRVYSSEPKGVELGIFC